MTDLERHDYLMDVLGNALGEYLAGDPATALRTLFQTPADRAERCGMAMALGKAVALDLVPEDRPVRTDVVVTPGSNPSRADLDAAGLASAVIAAAGNDDIEGAARAWLAAGPFTQSNALWVLLEAAAACLREDGA